MLAYFKDRFLPEEECHVSVHDRSFRFGDGIFETWLVREGRIYDFAAHKQRLDAGLSAIFITIDTSRVEALCYELIAKNKLQNGYVRFIASRGESVGLVGYKPGNDPAYFVLQTVEKPYPAFADISLYVSQHRASLHLPSKTNNALLYTLAMIEAEQQACDNALILDTHGHICETASGNIFWVKNNILYTPSLELPFVPGTMRARIMALWDGKSEEGTYLLDALKGADEIFMTNVGMLVAGVKSVKPLGVSRPRGAVTARLRALVDADILRDTEEKISENPRLSSF